MNRLIDQAAEIIRSGGVVVLPTETFYALAADPWNEGAVRRVFEIKGRPYGKPLPLIAADRKSAEQVILPPPPETVCLMDEFWPGSLTILLMPSRPVNRLLSNVQGKIGVRVPPACPARIVAELTNGWLTATSANRSGSPAVDQVPEIDSSIRRAVDLVFDLGRTPGGLPSTVVEWSDGQLRIIREGAVSAQRLMSACGRSIRVGEAPSE